jgi:dTMP kinase
MIFKKTPKTQSSSKQKENKEVIAKKQTISLKDKHPFPGILIVVEGTDGSGKSTQLDLLKKWLESEGYGIVFTEWNSSPLISKIIKKGKKKGVLNNETFHLLHATDFADRMQNQIIPALKEGRIVLADRYAYTALARDVARECDPKWVRNTYSVALQPDLIFYFKVPVTTSLERITMTRMPKFYEAGMDMKLSNDPKESYLLFQSRVIKEYDQMVKEFGFHTIDGTLPIPEQQKLVREAALIQIQRKLQ